MNIDGVKNGIVLDHIKAGESMKIYTLLGLEKLDCPVAIIQNVESLKYGKKDIIKLIQSWKWFLRPWAISIQILQSTL